VGFLKVYRATSEETFNKIKNFLKSNPKLIPIIVFEFLLLICAGFLVLEQSAISESVSVMAYFILLIGSIILLISSRRGASSD
jgi:hypothetical protein